MAEKITSEIYEESEVVPDSDITENATNEPCNTEEEEELVVPDTPDREVPRSEPEIDEFPLPPPEEIYENLRIYFPAIKLEHCQPSREFR
ncbi:hypothetical protein BVRB_5g121530 [Beta vulgaris subsp. vulgaris]|nr:hypothetical protein BVRB_5g121530 [Beta vulgaris subsp. vulgaris]